MRHHEKIFRCGAWICALGILAGAAWGQPRSHSHRRPDVVATWQNRLRETQDRLVAGEHKKARANAEALLQEMSDRIESGPDAAPILGLTLAFRALAEAGLGDKESASWDWYAALALDPSIAKWALKPFGAAGELVQSLGPVRDPNLPSCDAGLAIPGNVSPPKPIARAEPKYPMALANACLEGRVVVETIMDAQGIPRMPVVRENPGGPVMSLAALEAMRSWRFEPARMDGQPISVCYSLTVNFEVPATCRKGKS